MEVKIEEMEEEETKDGGIGDERDGRKAKGEAVGSGKKEKGTNPKLIYI